MTREASDGRAMGKKGGSATAHTEAEEEDETITRGEYLVGGRR
jgi:hypothetical protein